MRVVFLGEGGNPSFVLANVPLGVYYQLTPIICVYHGIHNEGVIGG